ncbi:hypothetical protein Adt_35106 [Abeliophyllum distichum]|uniref:Uncharacterized protein n=1 Tax=Abeliophyllum distichum TaxID=126358 RepID=A0ABD1QDS6_9LAMI
MVSFGSFDPIPISEKDKTFLLHIIPEKPIQAYQVWNKLREGAISIKLKVDGELTITYVYPGMIKPYSPNPLTFYLIMMDDLDICNILNVKMKLVMDGLPL